MLNLNGGLILLRGLALACSSAALERPLVADRSLVIGLEPLFERAPARVYLRFNGDHLLFDLDDFRVLRPVSHVELRVLGGKLAELLLQLYGLRVGERFRQLGDAARLHLLVKRLL